MLFEEHIISLSIYSSLFILFFVLGTDEDHIDYCFDIYDLNSDGFISREEMLNMMKTALGRQGLEDDQDEGVKVLYELKISAQKKCMAFNVRVICRT